MPLYSISLRRLYLLMLCVCFCSHGQESEQTDFGIGSHVVYQKQMGEAYTLRYREIYSKYNSWCERNPWDVVAAVERARFVALYQYSEDYFIEGVDEDYNDSVEYLETNFGDHPQYIIFKIENSYSDETFELAQPYLNNSKGWRKEDFAELLALIAERHQWVGNNVETLRYAELSFRIYPQKRSGLMLAEQQYAAGQKELSFETLRHPAIVELEPLEKKRKMDLLLDLGETEKVVELYHELKDSEEVFMSLDDRVKFLVGQNEIELARKEFQDAELTEWNRVNILRDRFKFELEQGTVEQASRAYNEYRDLGYGTDTFLRHRVSLLVTFPGAIWKARDLLGLLALVLYFGLLMLLPVVVIVPVHYWSLARQKAGKVVDWDLSPWGLKSIWVVLGAMIVSWGAGAWYWDGEHWQQYMAGEYYLAEEVADESVLGAELLVSAVMIVILVFYYTRDRAFALLRPNNWSIGKSIGIALLALFGLRILAGIHVAIFPEIITEGASQGSSALDQLMRSLWTNYGFLGLFLIVGLLGPVLEELFFRGMLYGAFAKHVPEIAANILQSLVFAMLHESNLLFVFYVVFGFTCGTLFRKSRGLFAPILVHVLNNTLVVITMAARFSYS